MYREWRFCRKRVKEKYLQPHLQKFSIKYKEKNDISEDRLYGLTCAREGVQTKNECIQTGRFGPMGKKGVLKYQAIKYPSAKVLEGIVKRAMWSHEVCLVVREKIMNSPFFLQVELIRGESVLAQVRSTDDEFFLDAWLAFTGRASLNSVRGETYPYLEEEFDVLEWMFFL